MVPYRFLGAPVPQKLYHEKPMTKKPRKTRPGQSFNDDQVIPTLKEHWAPTLSQEAAGNLYTFAGDGSVKFQIVPVPIHADRTPYTPAEVVNTINRGWTVPFFCSEGKEAKVWTVDENSTSIHRGKSIVACIRGQERGCGYYILINDTLKRRRGELITQDYEEAFKSAQREFSKPTGPLLSPPRSPLPVDVKKCNSGTDDRPRICSLGTRPPFLLDAIKRKNIDHDGTSGKLFSTSDDTRPMKRVKANNSTRNFVQGSSRDTEAGKSYKSGFYPTNKDSQMPSSADGFVHAGSSRELPIDLTEE